MSLQREMEILIAENGNISIAQYMYMCLAHPKYGYYMQKNPLADDKKNNFITAPQISQMFGEIIGAWTIYMWQSIGEPNPVAIVELGPGNGTMMKDICRIADVDKKFKNAMEIHLVEISPSLQEKQKKILENVKESIAWHENSQTLPKIPTIVVANEMLDALPIRQWIKGEKEWVERAVGINEKGNMEFCTRPAKIDKQYMPKENEKLGIVFETSPAREAVVENIAQHLMENIGAALWVDYGHWESEFSDTLQAIKNHKKINVMENIGEADITSHVDFQPLMQIAKKTGCEIIVKKTQGEFLKEMGIYQRAEKLCEGKSQKEKETIQRTLHRLTDEKQMGKLFKVMGFANFKRRKNNE